MYNRTPPDFKELASHLVDRHDLPELLETLYTQGYHAGRIDEQSEWWAAQDKDVNAQEG